MRPIFFRGLFLLCVAVEPVFGKTVYVNGATGDDAWSGLCDVWDGASCGPKKTIQAGITAAATGDTVIVADGRYTGSGNRALTFAGKNLTLRSANGPEGCIIDCENAARGIQFNTGEGPTAVLDGFTITNGKGAGAAIRIQASGPTIRHCILRKNTAVKNDGGGILCAASASPMIFGCIIAENYVGQRGGGICVADGTCSVTISNCVINGNTAGWGGGICSLEGLVTIVNCTIIENSATNPAGGVGLSGTPPATSITNSIVWGNNANGVGDQIGLAAYGGPGAVTVSYCDVEGGQTGVSVQSSVLTWGDGNIDADPRFAFADDFRLTALSPCVDAGTNSPSGGISSTDADSAARVVDGDANGTAIADVGAFERDPVHPVLAPSSVRIEFQTWENGPTPPAQTLLLRNTGGGTAAWQVIETSPWLTVLPTTGTTALETEHILVSASAVGLAAGTYTTSAVIVAPAAVNNPRATPISLRIGHPLYVPAEYATIQAAIDAAQTGDFVVLADGTYTGAGNAGANLRGKAITLISEHGADSCVIDAQYSGSVLVLNTHEGLGTVVDGLTIKGGSGGGIDAAGPTIRNCRITGTLGGAGLLLTGGGLVENCEFSENNHTSTGGGAIWIANSAPTIRDCWIHDNHAYGAAAVWIENDSSPYLWPRVERCLIENNDGYTVVYSYVSSSARIVDCTIRNNLAPGIVCQLYGNVQVEGCTISGNRITDDGAGIYIVGGQCRVAISNCTIADNIAERAGGGICAWASNVDLTVTNSTIVRNWALAVHNDLSPLGGGGIFFSGGGTTGGLHLTNSILRDNVADLGPQLCVAYSTASVAYSDVAGGSAAVYTGPSTTLNWGPGNIDVEPGFAFDDDLHLLATSPLVDAGTNAPQGGLPVTDADGNDRPLDGNGDGSAVGDIGTYEFDRLRPSIAISPARIDFFVPPGGPEPAEQYVYLRNCGGGLLNWQASASCPWLEVAPTSGSSSGEVERLTLRVHPEGLTYGDHACVLAIADHLAVNSPHQVSVTLHVNKTLFVPVDYPTIQAAIDAAIPGDVVELADGTYRGVGNKNLDFHGRDLTVRSAHGPAACIIDCEQSRCGFRFQSGESRAAVVEGVTVLNGYDIGGGIVCQYASPTVRNCIIRKCSIGQIPGGGGGIWCFASSSLITDCTIDQCHGYDGGGVQSQYSDVTFVNCTISNNTAMLGAGIYNSHGSLTLIRCQITGNSADMNAGGIANFGDLNVVDCVIRGNSAPNGRESYYGEGAGVYLGGTSPSYLRNCTIVGNTAYKEGGGIYCESGNPEVSNCILWDNTAPSGAQVSLASGATLSVSYSDAQGGAAAVYQPAGSTLIWGVGNIDLYPLFQPDGYHIADLSPCFNAGDPAYVPAPGETDIDDDPRICAQRIDIGADEILWPRPPVELDDFVVDVLESALGEGPP